MTDSDLPFEFACTPSVYNGYPGELITFFGRLTVRQSVTQLDVRVSLPLELSVNGATSSYLHDEEAPGIQPHANGRDVVWTHDDRLAAGTVIDYEVTAILPATPVDLSLFSRGTASAKRRGKRHFAEEVINFKVQAKGRYLQFLPRLYDEDEFMGRFLMLFESFWHPIEGQIDAITNYFDADLTPPDFLPWLASWLYLTLDERWPEEKRRLLLRSAAYLYRTRGTKAGLIRYLEIYTGEQAEIIEHRASNFNLGTAARLGRGIAMGRGNIPHTFTVKMALPPVAPDNPHRPDTRRQQAHKEDERRQIITRIIDQEKPAHTSYVLELDIVRSDA